MYATNLHYELTITLKDLIVTLIKYDKDISMFDTLNNFYSV